MPISSEAIAAARDADIIEAAKSCGAQLRREGPHHIGACPAGCARKDGFIVTPEKKIFLCRPSGESGDAIAMVRHAMGLAFVEAVEFITGTPKEQAETGASCASSRESSRRRRVLSGDHRGRLARDCWDQGVDIRGTIAETYLASRGLKSATCALADVIRFHRACPWRDGEKTVHVPAMVAAMRSVVDDSIIAIHRTRLTSDGQKVDRRMLGDAKGAAIKLDPDNSVLGGLHIGEGIETCLAARQFGLAPAWALGSKTAIAAFPVLSGVGALTVLAEPDAGQEVEECARRWHDAGREVFINRSLIGKDLADAVRGAA